MIRVAVVGECMIELTRIDDRIMALGYAGDTANTAIYLKRLAGGYADVHYVTAIGDDEQSTMLRAHLEREGLVVEPRVVSGASPALYIVNTDERGERTFTYYRDASPVRHLFADGVDAAHTSAFASADIVYFSLITLQLLTPSARTRFFAHVRSARARGARVAFDSNYRAAGWPSAHAAAGAADAAARVTDIALPSLADERFLHPGVGYGDVIERYRAAGVKEIVVKDGSAPTQVWAAGELRTFPGTIDPAPVDTTGAGDSFNAAYLLDRARGLTVQDAVRSAQALAGRVIGSKGAIVPL
ncbi:MULTISPECIES: sugar kinase [Microbacterium]|uniref:sugar kinase n=1 Tax=Microbacterium TaxID=33882 RepID=UPI0010F9D997|nr:sugar kinase [Microbacterium sp. 4NA327F11]MCK9913334.1 sugar kinase [Microbacteriaceae bacterium K1510]